MSTQTTGQRTRATCDECGLPYYADANDTCPYCYTASTDSAARGTETAQQEPAQQEPAQQEPAQQEQAATEPEPTDQPRSRPRQSAPDRSRGSILDRFVAGVRDFLRK